MSFLSSDAYAEDTVSTASSTAAIPPAPVAPGSDIMGTVLPFVFIFVVFYFLILRPQQRKFKTHQAMLSGIQKGDEVVTSGGILGKVKNVDETGFVQVEIATGVVVKVLTATVSNIVNNKPVNDNAVEDKPAKKRKK